MAEQAALTEMRSPERQAQWLAGRWTAKGLVGMTCGVREFPRIEILSRNEQRLGTPPQVSLDGSQCPVAMSIAHVNSGALVALSLDSDAAIGVDLACNVPTDAAFLERWFTPAEQQWIAADAEERTKFVWAMKEAVFKACCATGTQYAWTPTAVEIVVEAEDRCSASLYGQSLGPIQPLVQPVTGGLAVALRLSRTATPLPSLPVEHRLVPPTPPKFPSAMFTEAVAAVMAVTT